MRALALDIEVLAHIVDPQEAVNEQRFIGEPTDDARGDAEAALAAAEVTVELALDTPGAAADAARAARAPSPRGTATELTAWVSTQGMFSARDELAAAFGLRKDDVRVRDRVRRRRLRRQAGRGLRGACRSRAGARSPAAPCGSSTTATPSMLDGGRRGATRQTVSARRDA